MAKEEGWTGLDRWITSGDNSHINEQEVKLTNKGKCSAFGEAVVGAGRAEWDLQIDFESFGGISIGVYRQDLKNRDNINSLECDTTFTYTPNGYGYANKTGAFTANKERKKYGIRYRHGDKITVRLDLMSRDLTFLINDESQGLAMDNLPKGAYRLAACMQFKEQKVSILRFWNSLGKDNSVPQVESTITRTANKDKIGKKHTKLNEDDDDGDDGDNNNDDEIKKKKKLYADYKEPEIDPDADWFGNYKDDGTKNDDDDDDDDEEESSEPYQPADSDDDDAPKAQSEEDNVDIDDAESQKKKLSDQLDKLSSMTESDLNADSEEEENKKNMNNESSSSSSKNKDVLDSVGLIGGRSRGLSKAEQKIPEPLSIETIDDDATDFFSISGSNIQTSRSTVTCSRQSSNGAHSAFGQQLVSRGRIEWMLKIEVGHSIRIGVCGETESTDRVFTETKYGYGYGDDGNIYFGGSHIEYNDGYKSGDIVGVYLDMDNNTLKFTVNGQDHGSAFDSIKLNGDDGVNGYRLAVSLQHRPHKITLIDAKIYNIERRSPRPNSNQFSGSNGHQRKLSFATMQKK
eukprot:197427_1